MIFSYTFKGYLTVLSWGLNGKLDCIARPLFGLPDLLSSLLWPAPQPGNRSVRDSSMTSLILALDSTYTWPHRSTGWRPEEGRGLSKPAPCAYPVRRLNRLGKVTHLSLRLALPAGSGGLPHLVPHWYYHDGAAIILLCDYEHTCETVLLLSAPQIIQLECTIYLLLWPWSIHKILREKVLASSSQSAFSLPLVSCAKLTPKTTEKTTEYIHVSIGSFTTWSSFPTSKSQGCVCKNQQIW